MRKYSDTQLISMGLHPIHSDTEINAPDDIPDLVCGPYKHIIKILNTDESPKGFDPLAVQLNDSTPLEVSRFISAMTSVPHQSLDTPDTVETFRDIIPRNLDAGSFGRFFDNIIRNIPYKPKTD